MPLTSPKKQDVVIIGAGIAGLISGIELARNGLHVTICEAHFQPGGYCSSFKRNGFTFDVGVHIIAGIGNKKFYFGRYLSDLLPDFKYIKVDPWNIIHFPDSSFVMPGDHESYINTLIDLFPEEKKGIEFFFKQSKRMLLYFSKDESRTLRKYQNKNYQQLLDDIFVNNKLKAILSAQWCYLGSKPDHASAIAMCSMLEGYSYYGAYYPEGGSGNFSASLAKKYKDLGGNLLLSHKVIKINVKDQKVEGIIVKDNYDKLIEIKSNIIISSCDINHTCKDLIEESSIDPEYIKNLNNMKKSPSCFIIYLGVDINRKELSNKQGCYYNQYDLNNKNNIPLWISVPSIYEPKLAPNNKSIIQLYKLIPDGENIIFDKEYTDKFQYELIKKAESIIPDLSEKIIVSERATPYTLYKYTLNSKGAIYGWAATPEQSWKGRLSNSTPIKGLYLSGHWAFPGIGVMTVIGSGILTSRKIINDFKL